MKHPEEAIIVRISASEIGSMSIDLWATKLYARLKDAGIPVLPDGSVERGVLDRFDDREDFGGMIYVWNPLK